ncbi:hypothetical protein ACP70R_043176 [Stipagrostis hirtigluma subsp. patula]
MGMEGSSIAGVSIAVAFFLLLLSCMLSLCKGHRDSRARANATAAVDAAAAAAALAPPPRSPAPVLRHSEQELRDVAPNGGRPRRAGQAAGLPSFKYSLAVKHNVTGGGGGGEEAAPTCSVCLGAFQRGETVRLLPVCLHLFHVQCIDPWLDANSTCPICRSGTDPTTDGGQLPPV